jgi:hypothetical protein
VGSGPAGRNAPAPGSCTCTCTCTWTWTWTWTSVLNIVLTSSHPVHGPGPGPGLGLGPCRSGFKTRKGPGTGPMCSYRVEPRLRAIWVERGSPSPVGPAGRRPLPASRGEVKAELLLHVASPTDPARADAPPTLARADAGPIPRVRTPLFTSPREAGRGRRVCAPGEGLPPFTPIPLSRVPGAARLRPSAPAACAADSWHPPPPCSPPWSPGRAPWRSRPPGRR